MVAGIEDTEQGEISWEKEALSQVPVHLRKFGLMFQDYALFPHRNVAGNISFGLEMQGVDRERIEKRVAELLDLVGLAGLANRVVSELSGGEQQRVALARALAPEPRLLMLDEPLSSLDRALRESMVRDLRDILEKSGQAVLYVTHDQEEAYAIADRILLLNEGRIAQIGRPEDLYRQPKTGFVAHFLGLDNLFEAELEEVKGKIMARSILGTFEILESQSPGKKLLLLRPDRVELGAGAAVQLKGELAAKQFRGAYSELELLIKGQRIKVELRDEGDLPQVGTRVEFSFDPKKAIQVMDANE